MSDREKYVTTLANVIAGCATDILNNARNIAEKVDLPTGDVNINIYIPAENNSLPEIEISTTHYSPSATESYWRTKVVDLNGNEQEEPV